MKAAIYPGEGKPIYIGERPDPTPDARELVLKIHRCGICGTDLSMTRGGMWDFGTDVQFGHEYAGEIVAVGAEADGWKVGEPIAVLPSVACGQCSQCRTHANNVLCRESPGNASIGFAEYANIPVNVAVRLPQVLSMADGALIEPLAIGLYGINFAAIKPGDRVLVLGGGTVALYAIYWARRLGAGRIVCMSRSGRRKDLALAMGADAFITFGDTEIANGIEALGGPAEVVLECVGAEGMLGKAVMHAAQFGRIVSLGFCTAPDPVMPALASYKCVSMHFAVGYSMKEFLYIADQMDKGHVDPKAIITNTVSLADMPAKFAELRGSNDETKVHVLM